MNVRTLPARYWPIALFTLFTYVSDGQQIAPRSAWGATTAIEATLERATIWRVPGKLGRIRADGTIRFVGDPADPTTVTATLSDDRGLSEVGAFSSCIHYESGRIRCRNEDRSSRIRYAPVGEDPGLYEYELDLRRRDIQRPETGPVQIRFDYDGLASAARNAPCTAFRHRLVCRSESAPVCLPSPEVCGDGLDNDCDGLVDDQDEDCSCPCFNATDILNLAATHEGYGAQCVAFTLTSGHPGAQLNSGHVPSFSNSCSSSIVRWFAWANGWRQDGGGSCRIMDVWNCSDDSGELSITASENLACQAEMSTAASTLCP